MFTANFLDRDLESVFKMMAEKGYQMAELPAFYGYGKGFCGEMERDSGGI